MVGQLLSLGISPDIRGSDCPRSAHLHEAARNNNIEVAQLLITHKADIKARDEYNRMSLHWAARNNSTEVAQFLITHKADIEARDKYNQPPLDVAGNSYRNTKSVIRLLMKHTANTS